ncbi:MAG: DUF2339 domain-containing protein, partial [Sphingomonadales bacterium]|nr:DUF2339 domain-containing protein [Sphingomonadales bacterium]
MEWFALLLIGGLFVFLLWRRADELERQVRELSDDVARLTARTSSAFDTPEPARSQATPAARAAPEANATQIAEPSAAPEPAEIAAPVEEPAAPPQPALAQEEPGESVSVNPQPSRFSFDFEDIFGRRLPIWGGGVALAIAGIFLVRYSIEAGLVTPAVRVFLSFLFGFGLLGGAEAALRMERRIEDPRVRQALAGAGIATLFGAFYLAGTQYGLIGAGAAFLGLAVVTAGAIAASFRFGLPCAVLGLVGGFAAPVMVQSDHPNIPLLALYLALVTGGLSYAGRAQKRAWLGYAALAGGLLWGFVLLIGGNGTDGDVVAVGTYLVVLGSVLPAFLHAQEGPSLPRLLAAGLATLQMAALVGTAGFDLLTWGLYLLLGAALAFFGWTDWRLRVGSHVAAGIALVLLAMWDTPAAWQFAAVGAGIAAVFGLVPLAMQWRGTARLADLAQLALVPGAIGAVAIAHFGEWGDPVQPLLALACAALALPVAAGAWLAWQAQDHGDPHEATLALMLGTIAALLFAALALVTPGWSAPLSMAGVALVLWWLGERRESAIVHYLAWAAAALVLPTLVATGGFLDEARRLGGIGQSAHQSAPVLQACLRWLATALPFLALAHGRGTHPERRVAEALAMAMLYGLLAQVIPADALAWTAATGSAAIAWKMPARAGGWGMALGIAALWALAPLGQWAASGLLALAGDPMLADAVPAWRDVLLKLAPFALAAGFAALHALEATSRRILLVPAALAGAALLHSLWKRVFAISTSEAFVQLGMAERTVWQGLLAASGLGLLARGRNGVQRLAGWALVLAALGHFTWFTLVLHNPLWDRQAVGAWPIANWLLPAYAIAAVVLVAMRKWLGESWRRFAPALDIALMLLIAVFALSSVRHGFTGAILVGAAPGQTETLLYSFTGILLAVGFLLWGARAHSRTWRIGSLAAMLVAVFKVFLLDTAGLEGLLRIASFMALGFSLIGIGWFYSRQLAGTKP